MQNKENILVTNALPYANGHLHLGHILGYVQADIWVRVKKILGHNCSYVCGDDAHGTPIMINAKKNGQTPEEFIKVYFESHTKDFADFNIKFDHYGTTHSDQNRQVAEEIYLKLKENGHIISKTIEQFYDNEANMFLPDRFITGTCPKCKSAEQYGDNCEVCGATYNPSELIDPKSSVSNTTPIKKETEHFFFDLPKFTSMLQSWVNAGHLQKEVSSKLNEWFDAGLKPWDITRDEPYFGFKIPGTTDKYFYVWLDAPIGYISSFKNYCAQNGNNLVYEDYWLNPTKNTKIVHFIGKDITYFHALFWPAMLSGAGYKTPDHVYVNGFLTVDGKKMSKSRGTFIQARTYLNHLNPEYLRYYFAAKLSSQVEDFDLSLHDFIQRVNSDLVGKLVNIASRCSGFINKKFDNTLSDNFNLIDTGDMEFQGIYQKFTNNLDKIKTCYEQLEYSSAIRQIMELADFANKFIDHYKPWITAKDTSDNAQLLTHQVCSMGLNLYRVLISYLSPVLPNLANKSHEFLQASTTTWDNLKKPLVNHKITKFKPLLTRIQQESIDKIIAEGSNSN